MNHQVVMRFKVRNFVNVSCFDVLLLFFHVSFILFFDSALKLRSLLIELYFLFGLPSWKTLIYATDSRSWAFGRLFPKLSLLSSRDLLTSSSLVFLITIIFYTIPLFCFFVEARSSSASQIDSDTTFKTVTLQPSLLFFCYFHIKVALNNFLSKYFSLDFYSEVRANVCYWDYSGKSYDLKIIPIS